MLRSKSEHRKGKLRVEVRGDGGKYFEEARRVRDCLTRFAKQKDVAVILGVSRARVEQIELDALTKIVRGMLS